MIDEAAEGVTEVAEMLGIGGGGGGGGMEPDFPDIPNSSDRSWLYFYVCFHSTWPLAANEYLTECRTTFSPYHNFSTTAPTDR